jgi:enoyl-CoA hydratase
VPNDPISEKLIFRRDNNKTHKSMELYDVYAKQWGRLGIMMMNRHHKHNVFTQGFLKQLDRTLNAFEMSEEENLLIRFGAHDEETFSRGTDIKTLQHHSNNKDMDPIVDYLNCLFNFQTAYARNNKPLFSTIRGRVENSANWLVGSSGISCISRDAQLEFNETNSRNRIIPHGGASYYLTRMPGEMGTFLALTGTKFTGSEAQGVLGLADHIFDWNSKSQSKF